MHIEIFYADASDDDGNVYPVTFEITSATGCTASAHKVPVEEMVLDTENIIEIDLDDVGE